MFGRKKECDGCRSLRAQEWCKNQLIEEKALNDKMDFHEKEILVLIKKLQSDVEKKKEGHVVIGIKWAKQILNILDEVDIYSTKDHAAIYELENAIEKLESKHGEKSENDG